VNRKSLLSWNRGHFFKNEEALAHWQSAESEPDGMPLTADTIRIVGLEMAGEIRFEAADHGRKT